MFRQLGSDIGETLRDSFSDIYRQIEVYALLRLVFSSTGKNMKYDYEHSWLCDVYPDIGACVSSVRRMLEKLSMRQDTMEGFCRDGHKLLFDGTSIMCCSTSDSYVTKGYNSKAQYHDQYRILYVFDRTSRAPVFYRVLLGRMVDKAAFIGTIRRCSCKDAVVIADKGFYSKANLSYLTEKGLSFILPLQENTKMIPESFDSQDGEGRFDGRFTYNKGRNIWYRVIPSGDRATGYSSTKMTSGRRSATRSLPRGRRRNTGSSLLLIRTYSSTGAGACSHSSAISMRMPGRFILITRRDGRLRTASTI